MTIRESIHMYEKLHRQFEIQNSIGSVALERYSTINEAIPKSTVEEYVLSKSAFKEFAANKSVLEQYAQQQSAIERSLDEFSAGISSGLIGAVKTLNMFAEAMSPYAVKAAQVSIDLAQALAPHYIEATRFMREVGVQLTPLLREFQNGLADWNAINASGLASSIEALALEYEIDDDISVEDYAAEERQEVVAAITEVLSQPMNWQHRLALAVSKFKDENPALTWLFIKIMAALFIISTAVAGTLIAEAIKNASVREAPKSDAPIVTSIVINQTVTIIDSAPYYYEIEYPDTETGENKTGWTAKRCLKVIEESNAPDNASSEPEEDITGEGN